MKCKLLKMKNLNFTQEQINEILVEISEKKDGLDLLLKHALEAMMRGEREEYKALTQDMSNGYRPRRTYGRGKMLELRVPRTRNGSFYPLILGLLRDQEEEARKIAFTLYGAGMTTEQVGEVFGNLYGKEYSTSQVSRMFDYARKDVAEWLKRPLESYYPILFIDATFISTRREDHVSKEAYYTILGVRADRTREVLAIVNFPTESASAWVDIFVELRNRGVESTNLVVSDSLSAIEDSVWRVYPEAEVQLCVVHLERNVQKRINPAYHLYKIANLFEYYDDADCIMAMEECFTLNVYSISIIKGYITHQRKPKNEQLNLFNISTHLSTLDGRITTCAVSP